MTLPGYVSSRQDITAAALKLLRAEIPIQVRLMGLRMSAFHQISVPPGQLSLATFFRPKKSGKPPTLCTCRFLDAASRGWRDSSCEPPAGGASSALLNTSVRQQDGKVVKGRRAQECGSLKRVQRTHQKGLQKRRQSGILMPQTDQRLLGAGKTRSDGIILETNKVAICLFSWVPRSTWRQLTPVTHGPNHRLAQCAGGCTKGSACAGGKKPWVCQMCTFAENPWHFLRCQICDERRGSAPRPVPPDVLPTVGAREDGHETGR